MTKKILTFLVEVQRPDKKIIRFRLSKDLQRAMRMVLNSDIEGEKFTNLNGALINIPLCPYITKKNGVKMPPMGTGKVKRIYYKYYHYGELQKIPVTRSQFISAENWQKYSKKEIFNYLKHNYSWLSKRSILSDINYWKKQPQSVIVKLLVTLKMKMIYKRRRKK